MALPAPWLTPRTGPERILDVVKKGHVRRAKLYYLRNLRGKAARIRERDTRQIAGAAVGGGGKAAEGKE